MQIAAVFFDLDGTLISSFDAWFGIVNEAASQFGYPPIAKNRFKSAFGQSTDDDAKMFFSGLQPSRLDQFYAQSLRSHIDQIKLVAGARESLARLEQRGVFTAVVTNTAFDIAKEILESFKLEPDVLVSGQDVANPKPYPDAIFRACEVLSIEPWDVLMVGDSEYDRQAAAAAGSPFAGLGVSGNFDLADVSDTVAIVDGTYG